MLEQGKEENIASAGVRRGRARLVGYGLDDSKGHIRYTQGQGIELFGGSVDAHAEMQRRALVIQKHLDDLGISLEGMTYDEFLLVKDLVDRLNDE